MEEAIADGTEDRKSEEFCETSAVAENVDSSLVGCGEANMLIVSFKDAQSVARTWIEGLGIRAIDGNARVIELSGGNQQKVLLARALMTGARILVLFDPARGVDVGTKQSIYQMMRHFAELGGAILFYSSELPELVQLSSRCLVLYDGRLAAEVPQEALSEARLLAAAHGHGERPTNDLRMAV